MRGALRHFLLRVEQAARVGRQRQQRDRIVGRLRTSLDYEPETLAWNVSGGALDTAHDGASVRRPYDALVLCPGATSTPIEPFAIGRFAASADAAHATT
ncbi:hypothetical protein [Burkholderia sp. PU8-34]